MRNHIMTIHLPEELEGSVRAEVLSGHFGSADDMVAAAVREYFRQHGKGRQVGDPGARNEDKSLGSIGAMRDAAEELDEIVADAMKRRREEPWRVIPGE